MFHRQLQMTLIAGTASIFLSIALPSSAAESSSGDSQIIVEERQSTASDANAVVVAFADKKEAKQNADATSKEQGDPLQKEAASSDSLNEAEQAFVDLLTNSVLVGHFTIDGAPNNKESPERYTISTVTKVNGDNWIVAARIKYGDVDVPLPVPVKVHWAGDTPVISLTDLKLPGMGEGFTTRVLFYRDRYAGSWYHGKVGGHMWGRIETGKQPSDQKQKPAS